MVRRWLLIGYFPIHTTHRQVKRGRGCWGDASSDEKVERIGTLVLGFGASDRKGALERWTNHQTFAAYTCTCEYELPSCRGKSAGVTKRPRERSPTRNDVTIRDFCIADGRRNVDGAAKSRCVGVSSVAHYHLLVDLVFNSESLNFGNVALWVNRAS
jgi:hypothetical protein